MEHNERDISDDEQTVEEDDTIKVMKMKNQRTNQRTKKMTH